MFWIILILLISLVLPLCVIGFGVLKIASDMDDQELGDSQYEHCKNSKSKNV